MIGLQVSSACDGPDDPNNDYNLPSRIRQTAFAICIKTAHLLRLATTSAYNHRSLAHNDHYRPHTPFTARVYSRYCYLGAPAP